MRTGFVLTTIVLALALGTIAGVADSRLLARVLIIGFVPAIWAASHLLEWLTGREMWQFTAPYPYRWMGERTETAPASPNAAGTAVETTVETDEGSTVPLAA
jgi:hypothetical protein